MSNNLNNNLTTKNNNLNKINARDNKTYSEKSEKVFHIIHITDFHGAMEDAEGNQVAQVLAKNIDYIRTQNPDRAILVSGGDNYWGSSMSNLLQGRPVMEFFKAIALDASAVGEQEFAFGLSAVTKSEAALTNTPDLFVCCNLYHKETKELVFPAYKILEKSGIKFAIIGAITKESMELVPTTESSSYDLANTADSINAAAIEAKNEGAQVVIALIHESDNFAARSGKLYDITNLLDSQKVNCVLGGHAMHQFAFRTEDSMTNFNMVHFSENGIPVATPNYEGKSFIDMEVTINDDNVTKVSPKCYNLEFKPETTTSYGSLIPFEYNEDITNPILMINDKFPWDYNAYCGFCNSKLTNNSKPIIERVYSIINEAKKGMLAMDANLGILEKPITLVQAEYPFGESLAGNFTADAMRAVVKADFAFINSSCFGKAINAGNLTVGTLDTFMPYNNTLVKLEMTAMQIKQLLEQALSDDGKGIQVSGLKFSYNMNKPEGSRIISIMKFDDSSINIDDSKTKYTIATNDYLALGGDGLSIFQSIPHENTGMLVKSILLDSVKASYASIEISGTLIEANETLKEMVDAANPAVNITNIANTNITNIINVKTDDRIINATPSNIPEGGRWISGDFHNHSIVSDGSYTQMDVAKMSLEKFKLDWLANCDHGKRYWRNGSGQYMKSMWRWQSIRDVNFPIIKELRKQYKDKYLIQGCEWNVPTHEHASVAIIEDEPFAISDFEYMFNNGDNDTSREAEGLIKANCTHEDSILAVKWLEENYKYTSYCIINHPSKALKYDITHLRDYNNAAPTVCFGFEGMPGHQKSYQGRGEYDYNIKKHPISKEIAIKTPTYGGADYMVTKIGGVWDALLGEGRRFFTFANSDFHNLNSDFWPGEFQKNYTWVKGKAYKDIIEGMRSGKSYMVTGDLINELDFSINDKVNKTEMGGTHAITADNKNLTITIRFKSPEKNNNGDAVNVDHIDLIAGEITHRIDPSSPEYSMDINPTTKVIKTFFCNGLEMDSEGYNTITYPIAEIEKNMYFRLRGTNLAPNTEKETDAEGNPLSDELAGINSASIAYKDLWFYSNPIFVERR